ncbi:CopG family transcriptional regulator [Qipengyuania nanhaisediminis]
MLAACSSAAQAATYEMFRDPSCGCCLAWADHVEHANAVEVAVRETGEMARIKAEHRVPQDLWGCHTMVVDGYVIEGHVPAEQIARLLEERPEGVRGLAVAGMPLGSPGMEMGGRTQPYDVIAFGDDTRFVFASYN